MNEPVSMADLLRGYASKLIAPGSPRAELDQTRLGIPRQPLPQMTRRQVLARDSYRCAWCYASRARNPNILFEIDHIVPWSSGGSDHPVNLRTLCRECNQERSNRVSDLDGRSLPIVWRCYLCDQWGDVERVGPELIKAFCSTCRLVQENAPYVADLMVGGEVPTVGIPPLRRGDQDFTKIPVMIRPPERRFRDWRERDDRRRSAAARAAGRAAARAELDAIRPDVPPATFCAAAHPFDPAVLCHRLDGHCGTHTADGSQPWADTEETS